MPAEHLRASQLSTWLLHHSLSGAEWRELLKQHLNFPIGLFLVSTAGYMVAIFRPPRSADESRAPREVALLLLSCGLAALVFFPFMPYSGTYEDTTVLRIDRRYLIAPFLIGYLLLLPWLEQHARRGPIWTGFFLAVAISGGFAMVRQAREFNADGTAVSLAALVVLTIPFLRSHLLPRLRTFGPVSLLSCAVLVFALLATLHAARLRSATTNLYLYLQSGPDKPLAPGYEAIEELPAGSRITQYGQSLLYPTYGRRYQFVPVPSWPIGKSVEERVVRLDGHLGDAVSKPPTAELVDRLAAKQVGYVVISKHDTGDWPPERAQLAASKAARLRYGDGYTELWELRPVEEPSS